MRAFGYGWSDLQRFAISAMKSAFIPFDERLAVIDEVMISTASRRQRRNEAT